MSQKKTEVTPINKSHAAITQAAKDLFWKFGIKKVTVEEICQKAEVSKMTFYRNFKNKGEVVEQLIDNLIRESTEKYRSIMAQEIPYPDKVKAMIIMKDEDSKGISQEFMQDVMQGKNKEITERLNQHRLEFLGEWKNDILIAQKEGWIRKDLNLDFILFMLEDLQVKMGEPRLTAMYADPHDMIMEVTNFFFYGMMNPDKTSP